MSKYQIPGYHINPNDTLHKRGRDAPDVPLHEIQKQLLEYLGTFKAVQEAEEEIENKYSIKKGITGLWSIDDIKKAWGKTLRMNWQWSYKKKKKRAHWSIVIILKMLLQIKESEYDATETRFKLKEGLTASKSHDSPEETKDHSKYSAGNISQETKHRREGKRPEKDSENSEYDKTERKKKRIAPDNAPEKLSSQNGDSGSQGNYILQRKKKSEYDATKTQSKIKEGLTASKSHDSPEETKDHSKYSAGNISEETKHRREGKRPEKDSENSEYDKTEWKKKRIAPDNAPEKLSSQNGDSGSQGNYILQRKKKSEYDATKTQSKIKEGLTASKSHDSLEETKDHSEYSAGNISEETKHRKEEKSSKKNSKNPEKDDPDQRRKTADPTDNIKNASERFSSQNSDLDVKGIYIPLTKLKDTNLHPEKKKDHIWPKLIDGEPKPDDPHNLLVKKSYVLQYNNETNNAAWVFEILNNDSIKGPAVQSQYRLDYSTHRDNRAPKSLKTYRGTDYDRGHLAAAANHNWCQKARDDTNLLSNIVPQHKDVNRKKWKRLEQLCRLYVQDEDYSKAYIYSGPLYLTETNLSEEKKKEIEHFKTNFRENYGKKLPTHFFKVIILEKNNGERELQCYEIPNEEEKKEQQKQKGEQQQKQKGEQQQKQNKKQQKQQQTIQKRNKIEEELLHYRKHIYDIEKVSGLRFTEKNEVILGDKEEVKTVNFRDDDDVEAIMCNPIVIIPRQNVQSEE